MSWASVELENYDTAYCTACNKPIFRRVGEDFWMHNQYQKNTGSHKIEPHDITLSKKSQNAECAVLHQDSDGNTVPCPGHQQPECTSCHSFGAGLVQDAANRLKAAIEADDGGLMHVEEDLSVVLTALELHHGR